ncbi:glycine cleavage T C-terminal barrel domain-containing protein [Diaminobutyricibacter sp. McL0618]|uniref:glycine cleavage T C-terminal barrel domain-containing protein n=1 Tax=Leifsonia sp. McL0618 TaxID=3415677 RepID=UPI003CFB9837
MTESPIRHVPTVPFDPFIPRYSAFGGFYEPFEYTGWVDESISWKETCYIGDWSPMTKMRLSGPDAIRFFSDHTINSYAKFDIGQAKHAVFCNHNGKIMGEGILMRISEDVLHFTSGFAVPWAMYRLQAGDYDVVAEDVTEQYTIQQVQGPESLALLEEATGEDLRDIRFMRFRTVTIDGMKVELLRQGMAGEVGYELHGVWDEGAAVYERIWQLGQKRGIRRLGGRTKMVNHIEACFPTPTVDFVPAWFDEGLDDFRAWVQDKSYRPIEFFRNHSGSVATPDASALFRTPVELGWGKSVNFDHAFLGDEALRGEVADPKRIIRTLVWDNDDVLDIVASLFDKDEVPFKPFEWPRSFLGNVVADQVLVDGRQVGSTTSRCYSYFFREMISLAVLDVEHAEPGTRVEVVWGDPGSRQRRVGATVAPAPYKEDRRRVDVAAL